MNAHNSHHRPTSFGHSLRRHFAARCLHVVSDLGVADHIGDQPARIGELASSCEVDDPDGLDRVLRLLRPMAPSSASTAATATRPHHSCCAQRSSHDNACLPRSPAHATDPQKMPLAPEQIERVDFGCGGDVCKTTLLRASDNSVSGSDKQKHSIADVRLERIDLWPGRLSL
jgi:hypothetical protein